MPGIAFLVLIVLALASLHCPLPPELSGPP